MIQDARDIAGLGAERGHLHADGAARRAISATSIQCSASQVGRLMWDWATYAQPSHSSSAPEKVRNRPYAFRSIMVSRLFDPAAALLPACPGGSSCFGPGGGERLPHPGRLSAAAAAPHSLRNQHPSISSARQPISATMNNTCSGNGAGLAGAGTTLLPKCETADPTTSTCR